ncbi:uncharacterized protein LOC143139577 [Alosa pseudoharengus]|uniref:uncharacterized protein LOC121693617 n=1 Tax=Alosa sapidissima TaxID=34773 RepID=UPI001C08D676|nr:uncharacterized protein LOC121693617 [Alosa sapidissima]
MEIMEKSERAHFFTSKEQQLLIAGYAEERPILTDKSNTVRASKMREEAWQRIADRLNKQSGSGYKRTWQQVKIKYKNLVQTANRKKATREDIKKDEDEIQTNVVIKSDESDEEFVVQQSSSRPMVEGIPGGTSSEPAAACISSYIRVTGHSLTLLPPPQGDPEHSVCDETFSNDTHMDEDFDPSSAQEKGCPTGKKAGEGHKEDIKTLYRHYLIKEIENREQEMAYRALKMRKVEKEIQLLDRQLEKE